LGVRRFSERTVVPRNRALMPRQQKASDEGDGAALDAGQCRC
jgi:hypothetical protein